MRGVEKIFNTLNSNAKLGDIEYYIYLEELLEQKIFIPQIVKNLLIGKYLIPKLEEKYTEKRTRKGIYLSAEKLLEDNIDNVSFIVRDEPYVPALDAKSLLKNILPKRRPGTSLALKRILFGLGIYFSFENKFSREDLFYNIDPFSFGFTKEVHPDYLSYYTDSENVYLEDDNYSLEAVVYKDEVRVSITLKRVGYFGVERLGII